MTVSSSPTPHTYRRSAAGFTLIELVIALAIIAILAAIAYPSYRDQVRKSQRAVAKSALLDIANREERHFFSNRTYNSDLTAVDFAYPSSPACFDKESRALACPSALTIYEISAVINDPAACGSPVCFRLTATPRNDQAADMCGAYSLTSDNRRGAGGTDCW